jgi:hypothetical protein
MSNDKCNILQVLFNLLWSAEDRRLKIDGLSMIAHKGILIPAIANGEPVTLCSPPDDPDQ